MKRWLIGLLNRELRECAAELKIARSYGAWSNRRYVRFLEEKSQLIRQLSDTARERDELRRQLGGQL